MEFIFAVVGVGGVRFHFNDVGGTLVEVTLFYGVGSGRNSQLRADL